MIKTLSRILSRTGFSPNAATISGFLVSVMGFVLIVQGSFFEAALAVTASGFFDLLDGGIARFRGVKNSFGALLDSSLDRYSDALFFAGVAYYFIAQGSVLYFFFSISALMGSYEISYVRARSEGLGESCKAGFWERGERTVMLIVGLLLNNLSMMVMILGVFTHVTAWTRIRYARSRLIIGKDMKPGPLMCMGRRTLKHTFFTVVTLVLMAIWRP